VHPRIPGVTEFQKTGERALHQAAASEMMAAAGERWR